MTAAFEEWEAVHEQLAMCLAELVNAYALGNRKRIAECRKWVAEARAHEVEAYKQLLHPQEAMA